MYIIYYLLMILSVLAETTKNAFPTTLANKP